MSLCSALLLHDAVTIFCVSAGRYTLDTSGNQENNDLPQVLCKDAWTYVLIRDANADSVRSNVSIRLQGDTSG